MKKIILREDSPIFKLTQSNRQFQVLLEKEENKEPAYGDVKFTSVDLGQQKDSIVFFSRTGVWKLVSFPETPSQLNTWLKTLLK